MNISYIRMGEGKDLVFLHGYLASKESFYPQISYFSRFFRVQEREKAIRLLKSMIRKASLEESKLIYTENMEKDFPDDEIPDYNRFVKLTEDNVHDVYLYSSNNQDVAYFITVENNNNILIY